MSEQITTEQMEQYYIIVERLLKGNQRGDNAIADRVSGIKSLPSHPKLIFIGNKPTDPTCDLRNINNAMFENASRAEDYLKSHGFSPEIKHGGPTEYPTDSVVNLVIDLDSSTNNGRKNLAAIREIGGEINTKPELVAGSHQPVEAPAPQTVANAMAK